MKDLIYRIADKIAKKTKTPAENEVLNAQWSSMDYILNSTDFNLEYLEKHKDVQEAEHQIGRFLNMKNIVDEIESTNLEGDFVEFGTWQGNSLVYFARLLKQNKHKRKLVGVDSFEGLPHDSTVWAKGLFSNTALNFVMDNFTRYAPKQFDPANLALIKGWYSDPAVKAQVHGEVKKLALVHLDADLKSSTESVFEIIEPYILSRKEPLYFLFDDWGCHPDEVPDAFFTWLEKINLKQPVHALKLSSTRFTRYYKLTFE